MPDPKAKDMTNEELAWQLDRDNDSGDWGGPHDELTEAARRLRAMELGAAFVEPPPPPVSRPSERWCDVYSDWYEKNWGPI